MLIAYQSRLFTNHLHGSTPKSSSSSTRGPVPIAHVGRKSVHIRLLPISILGFLSTCQLLPELRNPNSASRQHAVLQTVEILPMDRRDEATTDKAKENARRNVVLPNAVGK